MSKTKPFMVSQHLAPIRSLANGPETKRLDNRSRMSREVHVRNCEQLGGRFPGLTRLIVHCKNETEARYIRNRIRERLAACKLELHPEKTKIVYCKQSNRKGGYKKHISFDFLGYTFRPDRIYQRDEGSGGSL